MKKLLLTLVVAAFCRNGFAQPTQNAQTNSNYFVNQNLRADGLSDGILISLIIAVAGVGAFLLRDTEMENPVAQP